LMVRLGTWLMAQILPRLPIALRIFLQILTSPKKWVMPDAIG